MSKKRNIEIGLGLAIAAVLVGYFLYDKEGRKQAKKVKGWMLKAKGEVLEKIERMRNLNEERYHSTIDGVLRRYTKMRDIGEDEILSLSTELKRYWEKIKKEILSGGKKVARRTRGGLKRAVSAVQEE